MPADLTASSAADLRADRVLNRMRRELLEDRPRCVTCRARAQVACLLPGRWRLHWTCGTCAIEPRARRGRPRHAPDCAR